MLTIKRDLKKLPNTDDKLKFKVNHPKRLLSLCSDRDVLYSIVSHPAEQCLVIGKAVKKTLVESLSDYFTEENDKPQETPEDIFNLDEADLSATLDQSLSLSTDAEIPEEDESNETILLSMFDSVSPQKVRYTINLPTSLTNVFSLRNGYEKLSRSGQKKKIQKDLTEKLNQEIKYDHYDTIPGDEKNFFAFTYSGEIPLLMLSEATQTHLKKRHHLSAVVPDVIALANLIHFNDPSDGSLTKVIVHISREESMIIITCGGKIVQLPPPIQIPFNSTQLLKTISGKLLYEQSLNNIPDTYCVVLTGLAMTLKAQPFFQKALDMQDVVYFTPNESIIVWTEEKDVHPSEFAVALGSAVTTHFQNTKKYYSLSLIPDTILRKQQVFKLAWHGYLILLLLFLTPIVINKLYNDKEKTLSDYKKNNAALQNSVNELSWVEAHLDSLMYQYQISSKKLELLNTLSAGSNKWSVTLARLNKAIPAIRGHMWLTELVSTADGFQVSGVSIYRNRPSRLAAQFPEASVLYIIPAQIRGKTVYQFKLDVTKITDDPAAFNPVIKIPEEKKPEPVTEIKNPQKIETQEDEKDYADLLNEEDEELWDKFFEGQDLFNKTNYYNAAMNFYEILNIKHADKNLLVKSAFYLGKCCYHMYKPLEAVNLFTTILQDSPDNEDRLEIMLYLGKSYTMNKQNNEARFVFQDIIRESPESPAGQEASELLSALN